MVYRVCHHHSLFHENILTVSLASIARFHHLDSSGQSRVRLRKNSPVYFQQSCLTIYSGTGKLEFIFVFSGGVISLCTD